MKTAGWFICCALLFQQALAQSFYKSYGSGNNYNEGGTVIVAFPDGDLIIGGHKDDSALVMKVTTTGTIVWKRCFKVIVEPHTLVSIDVTPDSCILGVGNYKTTPQKDKGFYFKLDRNGNVLWAKSLNFSDISYCRRLFPVSTGKYILQAVHYELANSWSDPWWGIVDPTNGNILSASPRYNFFSSVNYIDDIHGFCQGPGRRVNYTAGRTYIAVNAARMRPFIIKSDSSGNPLWFKYHLFSGSTNARIYGDAIEYDNDSLVVAIYGDDMGASSNFKAGMYKTDTLGNMIWGKIYDVTASGQEVIHDVKRLGNGYILYGFCATNNGDLLMIYTDRNGIPIWSKTLGASTAETVDAYYTDCGITLGNYYYFIGQEIVGSYSNLILGRVDSTGLFSCNTSQNVNLSVSSLVPQTYAITPNTVAHPIQLSTPSTQSFPTNSAAFACSIGQPNLGNNINACVINVTLNGTASGATSYVWSTGATTASIQVTQPGTYWVTAYANCCSSSDTIVITSDGYVTSAISDSICPGDSVLINSTYYSTPGSYTDTLLTTQGCDSILNITIVQHSAPTVTATGGSTICTGLSVNLNASGSQASYVWSPASSLSSSTGSSVVATPMASTIYTVTATDTNGCVATDTARVNVLPVPSLDMGNNAMVCLGDTVNLNISTSAVAYSWVPANTLIGANTPNPSAFPTVTTTYTVTVTGSNGCTSTGTVMVVVNIPPTAPVISENSGVLASTPAVSYQWYLNGVPINGATSQFYTTTQNGFYQVMITDANGCTAMSSIFNYTTFSLDEFSQDPGVIISPTLTDGFIEVKVEAWVLGEENLFIVYDAAGKKIKEQKLSMVRSSMDLSELSQGSYIVQLLVSGKRAYAGTIVKK